MRGVAGDLQLRLPCTTYGLVRARGFNPSIEIVREGDRRPEEAMSSISPCCLACCEAACAVSGSLKSATAAAPITTDFGRVKALIVAEMTRPRGSTLSRTNSQKVSTLIVAGSKERQDAAGAANSFKLHALHVQCHGGTFRGPRWCSTAIGGESSRVE